eukprot:9976995-Heterocapsa_arctica.AAC.1
MPFVRGPSDKGDRYPESKRRRAVGDFDLEDDEAMDEWDAAMGVLMSLGAHGPEARRTVSEIHSPPRITQAARSHPGLGVQPGFALDFTTLDEFNNP